MECHISSPPLRKLKSIDNVGWINSSFDGTSSGTRETKSYKVQNKASKKCSVYSSKRKRLAAKSARDASWPETFAPLTKEDLAVHKKKICEVEEWLVMTLRSCATFPSKHRDSLFLLLTGPPGCGKTATVKVLARELKADICEWSTSVYDTSYSTIFSDEKSANKSNFDGLPRTQASIFRDFFLRANKYQSLFSSETGRIVLIEEFPNAFLREPSLFHDIIRAFHKVGRYPVVFIISDCTSGESIENLLFPKDFQAELRIKHISFNPIAPTMLSRTLSSICAAQSQSLPKSVLEGIAADCLGDIRSAINALHFYCTKSSRDSTVSTSILPSKRAPKSSRHNSCASSSARDAPLFLFHALGKILYCKRDSTVPTDAAHLPPHLSHLARFPLLSNPEEVFQKTAISADSFALFLHENYLSFIDDIDVAASCSAAFSDTDALCIEWKERDVLREYAGSVVTRGLMFNLKPTASGNRWCPLKKPQYFKSVKNYKDSCASLRRTFCESRLTLKELQTELVPYLAKIGVSTRNSEQIQAVKQFGQMAVKKVSRTYSEPLSVSDVVNDLSSIEECVAVADGKAADPIDCYASEEEIVIEEYDSE